jgi:excisionase family DNA binding protein
MENPFEIIEARLTAIEAVLRDIQNALKSNNAEAPKERRSMNIDEVGAYIGISKQSIYKKTSLNEIPYSKQGKRLYFDRIEIDAWLLSNRYDTRAEAAQKADTYIMKRRK